MSDRYNPKEGDPRRRKLDDLFADEPFLSPTMKARRLHEKLLELQNREDINAQGLPSSAYVGEMPPMMSRSEMVEPVAAVSQGFIGLSAARKLFRQYSGGNRADRGDKLGRLKDSVLDPWIERAWAGR